MSSRSARMLSMGGISNKDALEIHNRGILESSQEGPHHDKTKRPRVGIRGLVMLENSGVTLLIRPGCGS
jgi:hypothetical protein